MKPAWHRRWLASALLVDVGAVLVALAAAAVLRFGIEGAFDMAEPRASAPWPFAVPIWIGAVAAFGLYSPSRCASSVEEAKRLAGAAFAAPVAFILLAFLIDQDPSRLWVGTSTLLALITLGAGRRFLRQVAIWHRKRGRWLTPAVVVGREGAGQLVDEVTGDPSSGYQPVATCGFQWNGLPSGELHDIGKVVDTSRAGAVLVVAGDLRRSEVASTIAVADASPTSVVVLPGLDFTLAHRLHVVPVAREPGLALETPSLYPYQRFIKRSMDITLSSIGLLLAAIPMSLIAAAIKLDSGGPVLFRQKRVGLRGEIFECLKFRTMIEGADAQKQDLAQQNEAGGVLFKMKDDPRLTRAGRILRRWSLDEAPQIWNVLRGDMSVVGPRPLPVCDYDLPGQELALRRRLNVRPGLTGLWQISGRSQLGSDELLRLDLTYLQNWSPVLDVYILLRTLPAVVTGRGAQ